MKEFTFITLAYNHEKYIIDHLESIKRNIIIYGNDISVDYILIDDCSQDDTVNIANKWVETNKTLFRKTTIIERKQNLGIVRNILKSIQMTKTEYFKFLAGDDKYCNENIFSVYNSLKNNSLIISPVRLFGENYSALNASLKKCNRLVRYACKKRKMKELIEYNNFIAAAGVFISKDLLVDRGFQKFIKNFRNIEDYPMWFYFITKLNCSISFQNKTYTAYRVGSGISKNKNHSKRDAYYIELKKINKLLDVKSNKYPKILNPYFYRYLVWRIRSSIE